MPFTTFWGLLLFPWATPSLRGLISAVNAPIWTEIWHQTFWIHNINNTNQKHAALLEELFSYCSINLIDIFFSLSSNFVLVSCSVLTPLTRLGGASQLAPLLPSLVPKCPLSFFLFFPGTSPPVVPSEAVRAAQAPLPSSASFGTTLPHAV